MEKTDDKMVLTGIKKRQQIVAANKMVFAWIVAASLVVGVCGVFVQFLIRQLMFNAKIYGELTSTQSVLQDNIEAYDGLKSSVGKLLADSNLNALRNGENSNALQVVIDALPTEDNRSSFATSMQTKVLGPAGVRIDSFSITAQDDAGTATPGAEGADFSAFSFSFMITGSYSQLQQAIRNMERSIRPITLKSIALQGTADILQANISAVTYYQSVKDVQLKEKEVAP